MRLKDLDDEYIDSAIYHLWGSPGGIYNYRRIRNWIYLQSWTFIIKFYGQIEETLEINRFCKNHVLYFK